MKQSILAALLLSLFSIGASSAWSQSWVTAYYPGWRQAHLPASEIDYDAVTHIVHFAVVPRHDGTLDAAINRLTPANVASAVQAAHEAGKKILFTVGGQNSRAAFEGAISRMNRDVFIASLIRFLRENRYDGIDVDMEEILPANAKDYSAFIKALRERLDAITPSPLLTAAVRWEPALFAKLSGRFDQINIMTYNMSGAYPGWITWHNGPLYDGGRRFPNGSAGLPSADGLAKAFLAAGVPRGKLGIGLSFNGSVWTGADIDGPGQAWKSAPQVKSLPYYAIADAYKLTDDDEANPAYRWDTKAQAAYLSIAGGDDGDGRFVSYANAATIDKTAKYVREQGLGGIFVWDLGAGYRAGQPAGKRDLLLQSLKKVRFAAEPRVASERP